MRHLRRAIEPRRLVAVLAALIVCLTSLPGAALCVGSDGHLAVESLGSECGSPTMPASVARGGDVLLASAPSLHGCTDTLLGTASLQGQTDPGRRMLCTPARVVLAATPGDAVATAALASPAASIAGSWPRLSPVLLL